MMHVNSRERLLSVLTYKGLHNLHNLHEVNLLYSGYSEKMMRKRSSAAAAALNFSVFCSFLLLRPI